MEELDRLEELKNKYVELGNAIAKLEKEKLRQESFLGLAEGDTCYGLNYISGKSPKYFLSTSLFVYSRDLGSRGNLNVFRTREEAEMARNIIIAVLDDLKDNLVNGHPVNLGWSATERRGRELLAALDKGI